MPETRKADERRSKSDDENIIIPYKFTGYTLTIYIEETNAIIKVKIENIPAKTTFSFEIFFIKIISFLKLKKLIILRTDSTAVPP